MNHRRAVIAGGAAMLAKSASARGLRRSVGAAVSLPTISSVLIAGSATNASFQASMSFASVGLITATTSDGSSPPITITANPSGFNPTSGTAGSMTLLAPGSGGLLPGNYTATITAAGPGYANSVSITPTLTAVAPGSTTLTINGSSGPVSVYSGDPIWFVVTAATGGTPVVDLLNSGGAAVRTVGPVSVASFQGQLHLGSVIGAPFVAPGSYTARVRYIGTGSVASVPVTVLAQIVPPFPSLLGQTGGSMVQAITNVTGASGNILYSSMNVAVVKGTVTLGISEYNTSGTTVPRPNGITMQFLLFGPGQPTGGAPVGGLIFDAGGAPTVSLNTLTFNGGSPLADGSYMVSCQCIDSSDTVHPWLAYQVRGYPYSMVVQNGASPMNPIGTYTIPCASRNGNGHCESTGVDFVNYTGHSGSQLITQNVAVENTDTFAAPPVYSSSSAFNSNPAATRTAPYWGSSSIKRFFEYKEGYAWGTAFGVGGVFVQPWTAESTNASETVEGSYPQAAAQSYLAGSRTNNQHTGNSNIVATPDVGPFASYPVTVIRLDGQLSVLNFAGDSLPIAGPTADPTKLQPDKTGQPQNPEWPNSIFVGTISPDPKNTFGDFGGGANDVVWDPRAPGTIAYICQPVDHVIICCDFRTQTISGTTYGSSNPYCYRYAGYKGGFAGDGTGGYRDGPALGTVTGGVQNNDGALFNGPYSIQMQKRTDKADTQGTMYVADKYNGLIRKIAPVAIPPAGTLVTAGAVSTLVGLVGGAWTPPAPSAASPPTAYNTFVNTYLTPVNLQDPGAPLFPSNPHQGIFPIQASSYSDNGDGTFAVILPSTPVPPTQFVPALGWRVTVIVDGAYWSPAGTDVEAFGKYPITAFTDATHFSVGVQYPGAGHTVVIWTFSADFYSPPGTVAFANAYIAAPQVLRMTSAGNIVLGEDWYNIMARHIDLTAQTIRRIGPTGAIYEVNGTGWGWLDVDDGWTWTNNQITGSIGACGLADDIVMFKMDSTPGSAATAWRWSLDGTYNGNWPGQVSNDYPAEGPTGVGHYPWAFGFMRSMFRMASFGRGQTGINFWRPLRPGTDPDGSIDGVVWFDSGTEAVFDWANGTCDGIFPIGLRPSFKALYGQSGQHWLGPDAVPTLDNLPMLYPTQFNTSGSQTGTLAGFLQAGAGGTIARPELSMVTSVTPNVPGRALARCLYFVNRQSLSGSFPTQTPPLFFVGSQGDNDGSGQLITAGTWPTDCIRPNITVVSITRVDATHINAQWFTDKPTIGLVAAGTPNSWNSPTSPKTYPYNLYSALETSYIAGSSGSPHSMTVLVPSGVSPMHINIVAKDTADNWNCIADTLVT